MLEEILQHFGEEIKEKGEDLVLGLRESGGYEEVEGEVLRWGRAFCSELLGAFLREVLLDKEVLIQAKRVGGQLGYRFVRYQEVGVRIGLGEAAVVATATGGEARLAVGRFRTVRLGAEQEHGQRPGEGLLADAVKAVEEVGVRQPLGGQGPLDEPFGPVLVLDVKTRHGPGPPELWRGPPAGWGVRQ